MTTYSPLLALFALAPELRLTSNRAVSVYLPARSEGYDSRFYDIEFRDLEHHYRHRLSERDSALMEHELRRLRQSLSVVKPAGCPAFAGFADEPAGLLELIRLRAPVEKRLEVGDLLIAPILRQLEQFPPALIAVVDKEHGKTFGAILDALIPLKEVDGLEVRHSRAGGTSAPSNQRKAENRAKANLENVAKVVQREMASGAYMNIYIGGPEEARAQFERMLPEALKKSVARQFSVLIDSPTLKRDLREKLEMVPKS
jgi:release factor family 10